MLELSETGAQAERLQRQRDAQQSALDRLVFGLVPAPQTSVSTSSGSLSTSRNHLKELTATESFALTLAARDQHDRVVAPAG